MTSDTEIIDYLREFVDKLELKIINGKIIDIPKLDKIVIEIKQQICEYNDHMISWYDKEYDEDVKVLNKTLSEFESKIFIFNELSLVSVNYQTNNSNFIELSYLENNKQDKLNFL